MPFTPCVEVPATNNSFLPQTPREILKQGLFTKVPTIIGSTSAEGLVYLESKSFEYACECANQM